MVYTMGSSYFFSQYPDFTPGDIDTIEIIDTDRFKQTRQLTGQGICIFQLKRHKDKQEYIDWALKSNLGMVVGKFLIPGFCQEIGFTVEDLLQVKPLIDILDDKHKYEEIIYNSYLANGDFVLTDEQRAAAYKSYKESRAAL